MPEEQLLVADAYLDYRAHNYKAAISHMEDALIINTGNPYNYGFLGLIYRDKGDLAAASSIFNKGFQLDAEGIWLSGILIAKYKLQQ